MSAPLPPLVISAEDRPTLEEWAAQGNVRAIIVLRCADGLTNQMVAVEVGRHESTVGEWRKRYEAEGIDGLHTPTKQEIMAERPLDKTEAYLRLLNEILRHMTPLQRITWAKMYIPRTWELLGAEEARINDMPRSFSLGSRMHRIEMSDVRSTGGWHT